MELHIKERLIIPSLLPKDNNFLDFNLKKSILKKISISEQDRIDYGITENKEENRIEWNVMKDAETPLVAEFTKDEFDYMKRSFEALSEKELPDEYWGIISRVYDSAKD